MLKLIVRFLPPSFFILIFRSVLPFGLDECELCATGRKFRGDGGGERDGLTRCALLFALLCAPVPADVVPTAKRRRVERAAPVQ